MAGGSAIIWWPWGSSRRRLEAFIHRIPTEPTDIAATGIDETQLLALLMK